MRVTAKEVVEDNVGSPLEYTSIGRDISEVEIAIIVDDVINREPRFLQKQ